MKEKSIPIAPGTFDVVIQLGNFGSDTACSFPQPSEMSGILCLTFLHVKTFLCQRPLWCPGSALASAEVTLVAA